MLKLFFERSYAGNVPKFFVMQALYSFMPWLPIWVIYLQQERGLTLTQVTWVDFAFWITMAATEVPTGAVADTIGRKYSVSIGIFLSAISALMFGLAPNFVLLMVANSLWAVAITFISGADSALFFDTLVELGRENEFTRLRGRYSAVGLASIAVSSILGGRIAESSLQVTFVIYVVSLLLATLLSLAYVEPRSDHERETGEKQTPSYRETLRVTAAALRERIGLRYTFLYQIFTFIGPFFVSIIFIQPHMVNLGIPFTQIGIIAFSLRGINMLGSLASDKLKTRLGVWTLLRLAPIPILVGLLGISWAQALWGIAIFSVAEFTIAAIGPVVETMILEDSPRKVRATILSVYALFSRLFMAVLEPPVGMVGDRFGLPSAFLLLALVSSIGAGVVLWRWSHRWQPAPAEV
jgi:MFS family permease